MAQSVRSTRRAAGAKKGKRTLSSGQVHIFASFNNTIVTVTDTEGNTVAWGSAGSAGFKGSRKSTPFAAGQAVEEVLKKIRETGVTSLEVYIKGPGVGRDAALRAIRGSGLSVSMIADITPIPHNGPKIKKKRRV